VSPTIGAELRPVRGRMSTGLARAACLVVALAVFPGCAAKPQASAKGHAIALPFIENDYPKALAAARQANLPVFVEVWAPW
jgi:hypothetical protein